MALVAPRLGTSFWELEGGLYLCWLVAIVAMLRTVSLVPAVLLGLAIGAMAVYLGAPWARRYIPSTSRPASANARQKASPRP